MLIMARLKNCDGNYGRLYFRVVNFSPIRLRVVGEIYPIDYYLSADAFVRTWCKNWNFKQGNLKLDVRNVVFSKTTGREKIFYDISVIREKPNP